MSGGPAEEEGAVRLAVTLPVRGTDVEMSMLLPDGSVAPSALLPALRPVSGVLAELATREAGEEGRTVSCRKGCGACCRQLVPVAPAEAHAVARLVEALPEPRRSELRARFDDASRRLREAGLLEPLGRTGEMRREDGAALGRDYFRLGIACPFLEEESCSIHPERPMACREYLVTSPAVECSRPTPETVRIVKVAAHGWSALAAAELAVPGADAGTRTAAPTPWVPLVLAPSWARGEGGERVRPSTELAGTFFRLLAKEVAARERERDRGRAAGDAVYLPLEDHLPESGE